MDTPEGMIEELRFQAIEAAAESGVAAESTLEWQASDMLAEFLSALRKLADGEIGVEEVRALLDPFQRFTRSLD